MKWLSGASLLLALAIPAAAADEDFKTSPYYPMQVGATWRYRTREGDSKFMATVKSHHEVLVAGGQRWQCAHVEFTQDGKVVGSEDVSVQDMPAANNQPAYRGVFRVLSDDKAVEPPVLILKEPPAPKASEGEAKFKDTWPVASQVDVKASGEKQKLTGSYTEMSGEKAPGTDSTGLLVQSDDVSRQRLPEGDKYAFKAWYVEKTGMVREEITAGGLTVTIELEKDGFTAESK